MRRIIIGLTITSSLQAPPICFALASTYVGCVGIAELMLAENRNLAEKPEAKLKKNF
jgi:hypothetical protein